MCEMLTGSRIGALWAWLVLGVAGFLPGFCLAQSAQTALTAVICCLNPDCGSDSFAGETADRKLSKPPFPHPPLSSS